MCPPLPKNDPEAWGGNFDNRFNLEFFQFFDEELEEPVKKADFTTTQARAQQGNRIHFPSFFLAS